MGQPDEDTQSIDNPIVVNDLLSFLIYGTTRAEVKGLDQFPRDQWPSPLAPPLLRLPHHGWPRHLLRAADAGGGFPAVAGNAV